jgi:glutaredoxin
MEKGCYVDSTKVIDWTLDKNHIHELYSKLYDTVEHGGSIDIDTARKKSSRISNSKRGEADSVDTPDSIVNWHTHPVSCYIQEGTVWGWPSGEDMRETIIYALRGSACHLVPAVEGTYTIQVNPCVINNLIHISDYLVMKDQKDLKIGPGMSPDLMRGFVILTIEIYFRSLHTFRSNVYASKHKNMEANQYVDFANKFSLQDIGSVLVYERGRISMIKFIDYVYHYEKDTRMYGIDEHGNSKNGKNKYIDVLKSGGLEMLLGFIMGVNCSIPMKQWHVSQIFMMKLHPNEVNIGGRWENYGKLDYDNKDYFLKTAKPGSIKLITGILGMEKISMKLFNLEGLCDNNHIKKHMQSYGSVGRRSMGRRSMGRRHVGNGHGHKKTLIMYGSNKCPYCVESEQKGKMYAKKNGMLFSVRKSDNNGDYGIKEAIDKAREYARKHTSMPHDTIENTIKTIPVVFLNGKLLTPRPF